MCLLTHICRNFARSLYLSIPVDLIIWELKMGVVISESLQLSLCILLISTDTQVPHKLGHCFIIATRFVLFLH